MAALALSWLLGAVKTGWSSRSGVRTPLEEPIVVEAATFEVSLARQDRGKRRESDTGGDRHLRQLDLPGLDQVPEHGGVGHGRHGMRGGLVAFDLMAQALQVFLLLRVKGLAPAQKTINHGDGPIQVLA